MTVWVSNGPRNLNAANGFYRAEAYNIGCFSSTSVSTFSIQYIPMTFANAGNCQGVILKLVNATGVTGCTRGIKVTLQQNTGSWVDTAATCTLTYAQMTVTSCETLSSALFVPFTFGTPVAVTTAASTWRLKVESSGGSGPYWYLSTSDATSPFYICWCDTAGTVADNDCLICKDKVTINCTRTLKGVLGTGDTNYAMACLICSNLSDVSSANVSLLEWENPAGGAYTLTFDGLCVMGLHSGFRAGTAASRLSNAAITFISPTVGTRSGFGGAFAGNYVHWGSSFFLYGTKPSVYRTTLASDAASGQAHIITTDDCSAAWTTGDEIFVGRQDVVPRTDTAVRTISSISGTDITLSSNLTAKRLAGAPVIRTTGYGIVFTSNGAAGANHRHVILDSPCFFEVSGVRLVQTVFAQFNSYRNYETAPYFGQGVIEYSSVKNTTDSSAVAMLVYSVGANSLGFKVDNVNFWAGTVYATNYVAAQTGPMTFTNNVVMSGLTTSAQAYAAGVSGLSGPHTFENNVIDSINISAGIVWAAGIGSTYKNNQFYGVNSSGIRFTTAINCTLSGNTFNRCVQALQFVGVINGGTDTDSVFGNLYANTQDVLFDAASFTKHRIISPTGNLVVSTTSQNLIVPGSDLCLQAYNDTDNDDRHYYYNGFIVRTGYGLGDTTVWNGYAFAAATAGLFGLRLQPNSGTIALSTPVQTKTTGPIAGKPITVSCRVKINAAAFYAGTYTLPTLVVVDNDGTTRTSVASASTADQQLTVTFTPSTTGTSYTYAVQCASDATGSNAYVYVGEMVAPLAQGASVDNSRYGYWADGSPLPNDTTLPVASSIWDEPTTTHVVAGSFGKYLSDLPDVTMRRNLGNVEAATSGDPLSLRSLYGMVAQGVNKTTISNGTMTVTKSDDATTLGTRTVTTDAQADPIVGLDTN